VYFFWPIRDHFDLTGEERQMAKRGPQPADLVVGQNIRFYRLRKGVSQAELGRLIGLSQKQVYNYEIGDQRLGASRMTQFAAALGVTLNALFEGTKTAEAPEERSARALLARPYAQRLLRAFEAIPHKRSKLLVLNLVEGLARRS
jgi:transcriptional regulator with XRE-family HTH domain